MAKRVREQQSEMKEKKSSKGFEIYLLTRSVTIGAGKTLDEATQQAREYLQEHVRFANMAGKEETIETELREHNWTRVVEL